MPALATTCHGRVAPPSSAWKGFGSRVISQIVAMASWSVRWHKDIAEKKGDEPFQRYLEGYFNSFDFYPVCARNLHARNDAYALWIDFLKVAQDLSSINNKMIESPDKFLALGGVSTDELENRKREAFTKSLARLFEKSAEVKASSGDT
jgi:hypothetical protein